jgi:hypothetical protein
MAERIHLASVHDADLVSAFSDSEQLQRLEYA